MGSKFVEARTPPLEISYQESNSQTAMFFILSPGVDPLKVNMICVTDVAYTNEKKIVFIMDKTCATKYYTVTKTTYLYLVL